jgi:hypothetical protein
MVCIIILIGCYNIRFQSIFKEAREKDTFDAYAYFLKKYKYCFYHSPGKSYHEEAENRMRSKLPEAKIKKLEIIYLALKSPQFNEALNLFESFFKVRIKKILEDKGFSIRWGNTIGPFGISAAKYYADCDPYKTYYYLLVKPYLSTLQKQDIDAILLFSISYIGHTSFTVDRYHDRIASPEDKLELSYHIFDLKSRERVFAGGNSEERNNTYWENVREIMGQLNPGEKRHFYWRYTETYENLLERSIINLFGDLPDVN